MDIKTFTVRIPRSEIENAYQVLKYENIGNLASSYLASRLVYGGIKHYFHSEGVFARIEIDGIDFHSDLEGFKNALNLVKKLPKNIVFEARYVTGAGDLADGLYLTKVDFKGDGKKLFSAIRHDPTWDKVILHAYPLQVIKALAGTKDEKQTYIQWLTIALRAMYPKVEFIPGSHGDLITKDEMLKALCTRHLYITLKKGVAGHWIVEGI